MKPRVPKIIVPFLFLLCSGAFIIFTWSRFYYAPIDLTKPLELVLHDDGSLTQGVRKVGQAIPSTATSNTLSVAVGTQATTELQDILIQISVPPASVGEQGVRTSFASIQGTSGMTFSQPDPSTIAIFLQRILPESHTTVTLEANNSYIRLSPLIRGVHALFALNFAQWLIVSMAIILATFIYCLYMARIPRVRTKDQRVLPPEKMSALDLAVLTNSRITSNDFAAIIFDLANRGHLQIIANGPVIYLIRHVSTAYLRPYEAMILELLFPPGDNLKTLQTVLQDLSVTLFSNLVNSIYEEIYTSLVEKGYFTENPRLIHLQFKTMGVVFQFLSLISAAIVFSIVKINNPGLMTFCLTFYFVGLLIYRYGYRIIPLSPVGLLMWQEISHFSNYLSSADTIGIEDSQGYVFYELLPFALVLKKPQEWLDRFRKTAFYVPSWFILSDDNIYTPAQFYYYIQNITGVISKYLVRVKDPNVD
jgi:hypothetical protein